MIQNSNSAQHRINSNWLGLLVEAAPMAVLAADERGVIVYVNAELARLFGYDQQALLGKSVEQLMPARVRVRHAQHRSHYAETPHVRRMGVGLNLVARHADGHEFPIEAGLNYININGELIVITSITDISMQQQASEELERQVAARTQGIQRRQQVAEALNHMLVMLNTEQPVEEVYSYIATEGCRLLAATASTFYLPSRSGRWSLRASSNFPVSQHEQASLPVAEALGATPNATQKLVAVADLEQQTLIGQAESQRLLAQGYRSLLALQFRSGPVVHGQLLLYYDQPRAFNDEEMQIAALFADEATLTLENARLRLDAQDTAVTNERNRIARDLHDSVTQTLFSSSLIAEVLPLLWQRNRDEGERRLHELRDLARGALAEMRTLLLELRPTTLVEMPLPDLLAQLAEGIQVRARVALDLRVEGSCELPPDVKIAFFHVAQEALNNVAKHANASQVEIVLRCAGAGEESLDPTSAKRAECSVSLTIWDDGVGFGMERITPHSLGVKIMRERAEEIDARWTVESAPGAGTIIRLDWQCETNKGVAP